MKTTKKLFAGILLCSAVLVLNGCYNDVEQELYAYQNSTCDTSGVTYANTVLPVIEAQCISCHNSALASGNILLDSYNAVKTQADNGKLYGSVNHNSGYSPMPKGGNKLSSCTITRIKAWIDSGAINN